MSTRLAIAHLLNACCLLAIGFCAIQPKQPVTAMGGLALVGLVLVIVGFFFKSGPLSKTVLVLSAFWYGLCLFGFFAIGVMGATA